MFVHPQGICESKDVGEGTHIWAFAHVLEGAVIGSDCNICDHVFIEGDVTVGDRVTIKGGVQLWDGVRIEDDVFIGSNASFANDRFPRSKVHPKVLLETRVCKGASIGAGAVLLPGIRIAQGAMVGAGAVVTHSVPPNAIVRGNPARIVGYTEPGLSKRAQQKIYEDKLKEGEAASWPTSVKGVTLNRTRSVRDLRGDLTVAEFENDIPFTPKRYFLIFDVPGLDVRGEHALQTCHQFLVCVRGSCSVVADDGKNREEFVLDRPDLGLYLPSMIWRLQYKHSADAILLVFASEPYDNKDYIRSHEEFLRLVTKDRGTSD